MKLYYNPAKLYIYEDSKIKVFIKIIFYKV